MQAALSILDAGRAAQESLEEKEARIQHEMQRALAHAMEDPRVRPLPSMNVPSAVTIGGVPVAMDGNMIYLGAGMYASAEPPPQAAPQPKRRPSNRRVLPGRVNAPPPGRNSSRRSCSAHAVPGSGGSTERSLSPSRAHSEGKMHETGDSELSNLIAAATGQRGSKQGQPKTPQAAPGERPWRPGGASKLPKPPEEAAKPKKAPQPAGPGEELPSGGHSEARLEARRENRAKGLQAFNAQAMMQDLQDNDPYGLLGNMPGLRPVKEPPASRVSAAPSHGGGVVGPPSHGAARKAEREALKEAKVQAMLEARAERLEMEREARAAAKRRLGASSLRRGLRGSHSAPAFETTAHSETEGAGAQHEEEMEKQKLRIACKMEILDFFKDYSKDVSKMTAEQKSQLLAKVNGGAPEHDLSDALHNFEQQRQQKVQEWIQKSQVVEDEHKIHKRLSQVNDLCNRAFDGL